MDLQDMRWVESLSQKGKNKKGYMYLIDFPGLCQWFTVTLSAFFLLVFSLQIPVLGV